MRNFCHLHNARLTVWQALLHLFQLLSRWRDWWEMHLYSLSAYWIEQCVCATELAVVSAEMLLLRAEEVLLFSWRHSSAWQNPLTPSMRDFRMELWAFSMGKTSDGNPFQSLLHTMEGSIPKSLVPNSSIHTCLSFFQTVRLRIENRTHDSERNNPSHLCCQFIFQFQFFLFWIFQETVLFEACHS